MKENKDVQVIENNYDNLAILKICKYLINVVINDIEYINKEYFEDNEREEIEDFLFDLGNGNVIEQEDLESLVSIIDTIEKIENIDNKELI